MKKLEPPPAKKLLLEKFIKPMNLSLYRVAKDSGIPHFTLAANLGEQRFIFADTAMRLGYCFGIDARFWLNLQTPCHLLNDRTWKFKKGVYPRAKAAEH
jgi:addiction module HigA family antidote